MDVSSYMQDGQTRIVISIDFEMGWGKVHRPEDLRDRTSYQVRPVVRELLRVFSAWGIRATWATVGHLALKECASSNQIAHSDHPRPDYPNVPHDWFKFDPMERYDSDSIWYAPDLVEDILAAEINHEIGSHGFSHMFCGPGFSSEIMAAELQQTRDIFADFGVTVESHVFPRNIVEHLDVLHAHGFTSFRGAGPALKRDRFSKLRRLVAPAPPIHPVVMDGMVNIPATWFAGPVASINSRFSWRKYKYFFDRHVGTVSGTGGLIHIWFHPHDFSRDTVQTIRRWESMLKTLLTRMDEGSAVNQTMREVAESFQGRPTI